MQQGAGGFDVAEPSLPEPGNDAADTFRDLYLGSVDAVFAYLSRRVGADLAEELTAQTFCEAWAGRARFDEDQGSFRSWVLGIATHLAARHWRTESRRLRAFARHGGTHVGADATDAVADQVDAQDMLPALAEALARLRADERSIVLLWAAEDLSYAEIADALSIPIGTVRSRLSRARRRLAAATGAVDG